MEDDLEGEKSGSAWISESREAGELESCALVLVSPLPRKALLQLGLEVGCDDALSPSDDHELMELEIRRLLERHNLNKELQLAHAKMKRDLITGEQRQEEIENFSRIIAHDLRNALATVQNVFEALPLLETEEERKALMEMAKTNSTRALDIIDAVYQMSGLTSDALRFETFSLEEELPSLRSTLHNKLQESGAELFIQAPFEVHCQRSMLLQAMENLVSRVEPNRTHPRGFPLSTKPKGLLRNYHTHTYRCKHADGDCCDYAKVAVEQAMEVLGFSDHTALPNGFWPEGCTWIFSTTTNRPLFWLNKPIPN